MTHTSALFETAAPARDPEGLITKFVEYEFLRAHRDAHDDDLPGRLADRMRMLFWYLGDHARERRPGRIVPLSSRQIAFLNSPASIAGVSPAVTVALYNFVLRERPVWSDLADPSKLMDAVYWWCSEKTPGARLDSLVTDDQIALLASDRSGVDDAFACNAFIARFVERSPALRDLDMTSGRDRAAAFYYLVLYAFANPHILNFLPRRSLRCALDEKDGAPSPLDLVIARYCFSGSKRDDLEAARDLRRMGDAILRREGLRLDAAAVPRRVAIDTAECLLPSVAPIASVEPGVAVVGPVKAASGLGQALCLSIEVLTHCERDRPTVYNFDLDNPSPADLSPPGGYAPYRAQRAINLIHLNAESIPLLYAYAPGAVVAESYNIGYFFWELNKIPPTHRLALDLVDEVWVASEYDREVYARCTDKPVVNVGMAVAAAKDVVATPRAALGFDEDCFIFLASFDSFSFIERKNPLGVLDAFKAAFPLGTEPARLVVKTQNRFRVDDPYQTRLWTRIDAVIAADPRIVLINETYTHAELMGLKRACDCYVSLHRSEGWGFGMIEAMQLGVPVIATAYSGNLEFCRAETAFLVDFELVGVREAEYQAAPRGSHWADPSVATAAEQMKRVMIDRAEVAKRCMAATALIRADFSVPAIAKRYARRLDEIRSSRALDRIAS